MAQISGTVRPLKRDTQVAAIRSSISASRLVPATSAQIAFEQSGSCSSGSSSIPRALCNGGADGGNRSGASSIHTSLSRTNSRAGVGSPKWKLPRRADHHRLPLPDRSALSILLLQQPSCFGIQPQQESWIGCHLGFEDQDRRIRLIGWGEEQAIQAVFPFFQHRCAEPIALHPRQEGSHQGLEAFGVLLEQPVEELVAGDHGVAMV
jgi:hypothetical protein